MTFSGDDGREMPHGPIDDGAFDALLAGTARDGDHAFYASFVDDVRSVAGAVPTPSPALAAALASGISPTATVGTTPVPRWRKWKMKIQGFVAGLGIAGKLALGAGVAAAATTGAGAAGVLPGPVQQAFAKAVHTVTPFEAPGGHDGFEHDNAGAHPGDTTTTTEPDETSTPTTNHEGGGNNHDGNNGDGDKKTGDGDGNGAVVTPTTQHHESDGNNNNGDNNNGDNSGEHHDGTTPTTEHHESTPPTTEHHDGDGEHHGGGGTPYQRAPRR